jgi:hypothetical protein
VTTCGCQNTCSCGTQGITVQATNPVVITVVPPSAAQSTQSTVVVGPGQGGARGPQGVQGATGTGAQGATGTQGIQGIQGIQGTNRAIAYTHNQGVSSALWRISHNLNFFPNVTTMDSTGAICEGEIYYRDPNYLEITFLAAFSGVAYLS